MGCGNNRHSLTKAPFLEYLIYELESKNQNGIKGQVPCPIFSKNRSYFKLAPLQRSNMCLDGIIWRIIKSVNYTPLYLELDVQQ